MEKDIQILAIDKNINFNNGTTFHYSKLRDKIGTYGKDKVESFKRKIAIFLERTMDVYDELDFAVNEKIDNFMDRIIDYYEDVKRKDESNKQEKTRIPVTDKLVPMLSDEEMKKLGLDLDSEDIITELKEFKKELLMENYQTEESKKPNMGHR